jgi:TonB family protein
MVKARFSAMVVCTLFFVLSLRLSISASAQTSNQVPNGEGTGGGIGLSPEGYAQLRAKYEKAAAAGDTRAMRELGKFYKDGRGVPQDYEQARQWFERAAVAGNALAMYEVGDFYENGLDVPQDYTQARKWFEKAAAAGNADAMRDLGILYENGEGVAKDSAQAQEWYRKAAAAGDLYSQSKLAGDYGLEQMRKKYPNVAGVPSAGRGVGGGIGLPALPDGVFRVGPLVTAPVPVFHPVPKYSAEAYRKHLQGVVVLQLVVDASGRTKNIKLVRGLGMGLDENAIEAAKTWLFEPGRKDGQPVSVAILIEVTFKLLRDQGQTERPQGR